MMAEYGAPATFFHWYGDTCGTLCVEGLDGAATFSGTDVGAYLSNVGEIELSTGMCPVVDYLHGCSVPYYLFQGKAPETITGEWDILEVVGYRAPSPEFLRTPAELGY